MGLEAICAVRFEGRETTGKAHLDHQTLAFRGDWDLDIALSQVLCAEARKGRLAVQLRNGAQAEFELGSDSEKWALKIRYPRTLIDKLGVKAGQRVCVLGVEDLEFWTRLRERTTDISTGTPRADSDFIFFAAEAAEDLDQLLHLKGSLRPTGSIWTIWRKGRKILTETHVREYAKPAGLVDVKVVSFSDSHSGLKLMIPKQDR